MLRKITKDRPLKILGFTDVHLDHYEGPYRMAEKLAEIRGISLEEVHAATYENGKRLYRIDP